jgi:hypothetical protein
MLLMGGLEANGPAGSRRVSKTYHSIDIGDERPPGTAGCVSQINQALSKSPGEKAASK